MSNDHLTDVRYDSFDIDPSILKGLNDINFEFCTPIQAESIPIALSGKDVAGEAQTGTGKTAAFLVACFEHLLKNPVDENNKQPRALILAPTRELAIQIHKDALAIGKHTGLKFGLAYGGTGYDSQRKQIEEGIGFFRQKYPDQKYMIYFQAYTNTYADSEKLKKLYYEALDNPGVEALAIAGPKFACVPRQRMLPNESATCPRTKAKSARIASSSTYSRPANTRVSLPLVSNVPRPVGV